MHKNDRVRIIFGLNNLKKLALPKIKYIKIIDDIKFY